MYRAARVSETRLQTPAGVVRTELRVNSRDTGFSVKPGSLPGYTGWARPSESLAGYFRLVAGEKSIPRQIQTNRLEFLLECHGHPNCQSKSNSKFFVRAYGPTITVGAVSRNEEGFYRVEIDLPEVGLYTVEVVLLFSNAERTEEFPLLSNQTASAYEGYPVHGFPIVVRVQSRSPQGAGQCRLSDMIEDTFDQGRQKGYWIIPNHQGTTNMKEVEMHDPQEAKHEVSENSAHHLIYQRTGCTLPGHSAKILSCFSQGSTHFILIGDSVMRLQRNWFLKYTENVENFRISLIELYGGFLRSELLTGPKVEQRIQEIQRRFPDDQYVIVYNTGMHDIHRLCDATWEDDRKTYLHSDSDQSCTGWYKTILVSLSNAIIRAKADVRLFQSTSGAWPKYGNSGVSWPDTFQRLPLDASFIQDFNRIAFSAIHDSPDIQERNKIQIVDGFWMSYSRPDNREEGEIGKKLSHPGDEVIAAMVEQWSFVSALQLCR